MEAYSHFLSERREVVEGWRSEYVCSLDIGQAVDPSAFCVVEKVFRGVFYDDGHRDERDVEYRVRHLERLPLRMSYPQQAQYVRQLMGRPELRDAVLVLDGTGVGAAVVEIFAMAGFEDLESVVITGGEKAAFSNGSWKVPKAELITGVMASLHTGELKFAAGMAEAEVLKRELADFRLNYSATGAMQFGARVGKHDDLVLAVALGVWRARRGPQCISMDWDDGR